MATTERVKAVGMVLFAFVVACSAECRVVKVSDFGFNSDDSTEIVQRAFDSGASKLLFDRQPGPWVVRPLFVRSNTEIVFEEGVELLAKEGEFHDLFDALVTLRGVTNVTLRGLGKGATLRMRIKDYQGPAYSHGEWRHAVNLLSVSDVTIENLTLADSGGDGIYVGAKPAPVPCRNVVIRDCICDNNNRQGISVISADGLLIERTVMKNTRGTAPKSGIDFEPNVPLKQVLKNIVMRDCLTQNNDGSGYDLNANGYKRGLEPIDITLENCRSENDNTAVNINFFKGKDCPSKRDGLFLVKNCTFKNYRKRGVSVMRKENGVVDTRFEDCTMERSDALPARMPDVNLITVGRKDKPTDGVEFRNLTIVRHDAAPSWFQASQMPWSSVGMDNVKGMVRFVLPGGTTQTLELDDAWRKAAFPRSGEKYVVDDVAFDAANVRRVVDEKPGERTALSPLTIRFGLDALVYAAKPGPVTFAVRLDRVGSRKIKDGSFKVKDMAGRMVATLSAAMEKSEDRTFAAPATGFYRLSCDVLPHGLVFESCDAPIGFLPIQKYRLDIYKSQGDIYFAHGAGVDETFFCGGSGEAATITLFEPSGLKAEVWRNQMAWGFRRISPEAAEGLWRVNIAHPGKGYTWEDSRYDRTGTPPVFFLSKEKYWISDGRAACPQASAAR